MSVPPKWLSISKKNKHKKHKKQNKYPDIAVKVKKNA